MNRTLRLTYPANILILHLKRFSDTQEKKNTPVQIYGSIDLSQYSYIPVSYALKAIIVHVGTVEQGHYVSYTKKDNNQVIYIFILRQWYLFDDDRVT